MRRHSLAVAGRPDGPQKSREWRKKRETAHTFLSPADLAESYAWLKAPAPTRKRKIKSLKVYTTSCSSFFCLAFCLCPTKSSHPISTRDFREVIRISILTRILVRFSPSSSISSTARECHPRLAQDQLPLRRNSLIVVPRKERGEEKTFLPFPERNRREGEEF